MKRISESLDIALKEFIGTTCYYKLNENLLITEGIYFLVTECNAYWLIYLAFNHLVRLNFSVTFVVIKIRLISSGYELSIKNGEGRNLSRQKLFLLDATFLDLEIYGNKEAKIWFLILPSEY